jgi:hypothetical protein
VLGIDTDVPPGQTTEDRGDAVCRGHLHREVRSLLRPRLILDEDDDRSAVTTGTR